MRVGILSREFFGSDFGGYGGFGWLALHSARALAATGRIEPIFLDPVGVLGEGVDLVHGFEAISLRGNRVSRAKRLRRAKIDHILTIDWRKSYAHVVDGLWPVPVTVWVQAPRSAFDQSRIATLRIPGSSAAPAGITRVDCTSLAPVIQRARLTRRRIHLATHARYLDEKVLDTYGVRVDSCDFLGDPIGDIFGPRSMTDTPSVVFLGRLDPIKRPWLFTTLAQEFPEVEFHLLGASHFQGAGSWTPGDLPPNVIHHGHVDGHEKARLLSASWALVNTSIHEALPISFLESLMARVPVLGMCNPDEIVSRYGEYAGRWDGDGTEGLPYLKIGLGRLLGGRERNLQLGEAGYEWVKANHSVPQFTKQFLRLADLATRS